jgi:thymidylate kinase
MASLPGTSNMLSEFDMEQKNPPLPQVEERAPSSGPGRILAGVFEALDRAAIPYCVLHGYEGFPDHVTSDVDFLIDPSTSARQLLELFHRERNRIGAAIVRSHDRFFVLAGKNADGSPCSLMLDFYTAGEADGVVFSAAAEVLKSRRRYRQFWIAETGHEFAFYLARSILKRRLDVTRTRRLSDLHWKDATACETAANRLWQGSHLERIIAAAKGGNWEPVRQSQEALRSELRKQAMLRHPLANLGRKISSLSQRIDRLLRPNGFSIAFLGPDGAGKSSLIEALENNLTCVFPRSVCWGFVPHLRRLLRRPATATDKPHALPPRSLATSLIRVAYWLSFNLLGYLYIPLTLARSTLILNDRHFVDLLVDPTRYRYGGPSWLPPLLWRLCPKPHLIVLLDAPAEVLQARKQELPLEVTARQRKDYLALIRTLGNGCVIDAAQPADKVANDVSNLIITHLAERLARRFRLG